MSSTFAERVVERIAGRTGPDRRGFLRGTTLVGAALATTPWSFVTRPASAYDAVCGSHNTCAGGYTVFCCTINGGRNTCPPNSFVAGWWKADNAAFCNGAARYYVDCNAYRDGAWACRCNDQTCDQRLVACNQFRYGQCNTQVPWSNTGPVVCRLVSCTPPWQEYAGACSTTSRTDNNTVTHAAPCLYGNVPVGNVESLSSSGNTVRITGWALDRDEPGTSLNVAVYQDGNGVGWFRADGPRPDVNAGYGVSGGHGFDIRFQAADGPHEFTVFALNVGPGVNVNPVLAQQRLVVNPGTAPTGNLELLTSSGNSVRLAGWALDRDRPAESIPVAVYLDGVGVSWFPTDRLRPDVNAAFAATGPHGYDVTIEAGNGLHVVEVWGINTGPVGPNVLLARQALDVNPGFAPRGNLDSVVASGEQVRLRGWAYDPDLPGTAIPVAVYDGSRGISWFPTGVARPDVNAAFGIDGAHGFEITVPAGPGPHTYSVYAINVGGGALNPAIGSRAVTVGQPGAVGTVERVSSMGPSVRVQGWTFDRSDPETAIPVAVYLDGAGISWFPTGLDRPDVNDAYAVGGSHGFDVSFDATPGRHAVTVYAIDSSGRSPVIGGGDVVVAP